MGNPVRPLHSTPTVGPGPVPVNPERELPSVHERDLPGPGNKLNGTAERVGEFAGRTVEGVRELPRRLAELKERFIVIRGRARENASGTAAEWKQTAAQRVRVVRNRAETLADEYPAHVIVGAAALAFVLGFVLRVWRSNHARD